MPGAADLSPRGQDSAAGPTSPGVPPGGGRFRVRWLPGAPALVEKRGAAGPLAREAAALRLLAGRAPAPALVRDRPGELVTRRLPGAPRPLGDAGADELRALGAVLRRVHDAWPGRAGGLPHWPAPATGLEAYRRARAEDAARLLGPGPDARLARALGRVPASPCGERRPFRLVHGDLVAANLVWHEGVPVLVDWEFWRMGDPAEDLAYLTEVNDLGAASLDRVLDGYGDPGMAVRLGPWRGLMALEAGAWYRAAGHRGHARRLLARGRALAGAATGPRAGVGGPRGGEAAR